MNIVIHHNPDCGTSRDVFEMIRAVGYKPTIIAYLKEGWTRAQLPGLFAAAGLTPLEALRVACNPAEAFGLTAPNVPDEVLLTAMVEHPILVNRPIVCTHKGVRLCRPFETVLDLFDTLPPGSLAKEDGQIIIDDRGNRIA